MELVELINYVDKRQSVRSFDGEKISENDRRTLTGFAAEALSFWEADDSRITVVDIESVHSTLVTYGVIGGCRSYLVLVSKTQARDENMRAAAAMELCVLEATRLGLATCWLGGTFRRSLFTSALNLAPDEDILAIVAVGYSAPSRFVDRMMQTLVRSRERKEASQLFFSESISEPLPPDSHMMKPLNYLRLAPSSSNSQPWRIFVLDDSTFDLCSATDNRYTNLDMGIAMAHLAVGFAPVSVDFARPQGAYPRLLSVARCFLSE